MLKPSVAVIAAILLSIGCVLPVAAHEPWDAAGYPSTVSQPVTFTNDGATLRGTLYRPSNATRPVPAVVVFHGAKVGNGDAALYRHLREGLPEMGIAVLLFDRRGTGKSTGTLHNVSYEVLADDGIAGARAIAKLPQIDAKRIGYWGLSQGGWLSIFAAERDHSAAFAVSASAPLTTPESQMEFAMSNRLHVGGYPQSDIDAMIAARKAWTGYLRGTRPRSTAVAALSKIDHKPWFDLMFMPSSSELTKDPATSSWRKEMDDDPALALEKLRVPTLIIFGGEDPWTPVEKTVAVIRSIQQRHSNIQYAVLPGANHDMMLGQRETMASDPHALRTGAPQDPAYFMLLASWLQEHAFAH